MYNKPLSYSSLSLWKRCPAAWEWKYIMGNYGSSGAAADRGTALHDTLETYYKHPGAVLPVKENIWAPWRPLLEPLKEFRPVAEGEVAVNDKWERVGWKDPTAMYRGKLDLGLETPNKIFIFDWKSGKIYDDHAQQGKDYVALSPLASEYTVLFAYLDQPRVIHRWTYTAEDRVALQQDVSERVLEVRSAEHYPFNRGPHCRYCDRSRSRGGDCKYN